MSFTSFFLNRKNPTENSFCFHHLFLHYKDSDTSLQRHDTKQISGLLFDYECMKQSNADVRVTFAVLGSCIEHSLSKMTLLISVINIQCI